MLARLGDPSASIRPLHVAGTNGKGSVCAMIESVLRAAGWQTGLYTSPHLIRFHERIRVNGRPIADADLARRIDEAETAAAAVEAETGGPVTFFEMATVMALAHFGKAGVTAAVIETGMGGRLDATTVVTPLLTVITEIDLDHVEHLGHNREEIAREKGGIIRRGRPVVCGEMADDVRRVIAAIATARSAPFIEAPTHTRVRRRQWNAAGQTLDIETDTRRIEGVPLPLAGPHQARNAALAVAALETWAARVGRPLPDDAVRRGFAAVQWPARFQTLEQDPPVFLDGAHNPHAAAALAATLAELPPRPTALVAGMMADKDHAGFFAALRPVADRVWTVPVATNRAVSPATLADRAAAAGMPAVASRSVAEGVAAAIAWARSQPGQRGRIVIAGSLYLAGEVLTARGARLFEGVDEDGGP